MTSALPVTLFLVPFVAALLATLFGWWVRGAARLLTLGGLAVTTALSLWGAARVFAEGTLVTHLGNWAPPIGIELVLDPLAALMAVLVAGTAFITLAGSGEAIRAELSGRGTSFHATALLLVAGLLGIVITGDLFNLFVQLEVASLSAYALVAAGGRGAPRAALNYLLIGSLGASLYLMGVGFLYAATGTLNMADMAARLPGGPLALTGAAFIAAGLAVKMALFPVHGWMPSAYARGPAVSASLMAPLVTKVAAYALLRVLFFVYGSGRLAVDGLPALLDLLGLAGAAAVVAGGVLAFVQQDLRRMLAYSSVSQVGIVAVGIALANRDGLTGAVLHIGNDALMKGALFLAAGALLARSGVTRVDQLARLRGRAPWTTLVLAVAGVSLIGLPPLAGFFGKWYVLLGALQDGRWVYVAALTLGTALTAAYVFRVLEPLLFGKSAESADDASLAPPTPHTSPDGGAALAGALAFTVLIVAAGVFNGPLAALVRAALPEGGSP